MPSRDDTPTDIDAAATPQPTDPRLREKEWFVAIDDTDVGPVDILEIENRWNASDLTAESLAWRPGMTDWQPIAELPDLLSFLKRNRDLAKIEMPPVLWKSERAATLADLVAHELEAEKRQAQIPEAVPTAALLGLPDLGSIGFGAQASWDKSWGIPTPEAWTPEPTPWLDASKTVRAQHSALILLSVGLGALVIALSIWVVALLKQPPLTPRKETSAPAVALALPPLVPLVAPTSESPQAPAPGDAPTIATPIPTPTTAEASKPAKDRPSRPKKAAAPRPAETEAGGDELSSDEILATVKENAASFAPCIRAARSKNQIAPGKIRLVLAWDIERSGAVREPRLTGPAQALDTSLPGCLAAKMRGWVFRASSDTSTIRNFPLSFVAR